MQIGYMTTLAQPPDIDYAQLLDELREQAVLCDQGGFEHIWLAEHHFGTDGHDNSPNPFMLAADVGARTERIRLGIAVVVLPLWHPLRAAENITLLDQMFRGRIAEIGFGRASRPHEVTAFNLDANPRNVERSRELFRECIEIVRKACTEKYFEHIGEHYRIPPENTPWTTAKGIEPDPEWVRDGQIYRLGIVPKPYQTPHPAFSMACSSDSRWSSARASGCARWPGASRRSCSSSGSSATRRRWRRAAIRSPFPPPTGRCCATSTSPPPWRRRAGTTSPR